MKITQYENLHLRRIIKCGGVFKYYNSLGNADFQYLRPLFPKISRRIVDRLLKKGLLVPQYDGLFGDSQVYRVLTDINIINSSAYSKISVDT